jgi:FKBP-type peptidyl-prolyl cis-trans isomerase
MTIFTQKSSKMKAFQSILGFFGLFLAIFLISSCSKSSISEIDQMKSFATKNNIEYITDPSGLMYQIVNPGVGTKPRTTSTVSALYTGTFLDGKVFESPSSPVSFPLSMVIKSWQIAVPLIAPGGEIKIISPSSLAYGQRGSSSIPANTPLYFNIKLVSIVAY